VRRVRDNSSLGGKLCPMF